MILKDKATEVYVRLAAEDIIITKDEYDNDKYGTDCTYYLVGFEDAEGNECEEDGTYINKKYGKDN
jgi:hypothetical protein